MQSYQYSHPSPFLHTSPYLITPQLFTTKENLSSTNPTTTKSFRPERQRREKSIIRINPYLPCPFLHTSPYLITPQLFTTKENLAHNNRACIHHKNPIKSSFRQPPIDGAFFTTYNIRNKNTFVKRCLSLYFSKKNLHERRS